MSWANMLAPPASFATSRRGSAPSALRRSIRNGTAVSGNFAGLLMSRARLLEGRSTCAMAPAPARRSCSMIVTLGLGSCVAIMLHDHAVGAEPERHDHAVGPRRGPVRDPDDRLRRPGHAHPGADLR